MNRVKPIAAALLSVLAVLLLLPLQALAADSIDLNRPVSLNISYQDGDTPLAGASFDIFLVATVDEYGELTATEDFARFKEEIDIRGENDEAWRALASTLEGYVSQLSPADSGKTDEEGQLSWKKLTAGLYFVQGTRHTQNGYRYDLVPFLVMLPALDRENNAWIYDMEASPKFTSSPVPSGSDNYITRKVLKVWEDDGHEQDRPGEVIVQLLRDGKVYDTVTLNAANNWRHTWKGLNDRYAWTLAEKETEGYSVKITREGITFVVTNTYSGESPNVSPPPDTSEPPTASVPPAESAPPTTSPPPTEPAGPTTPVGPTDPTDPTTPSKPGLPQTGQLWWPVPVLLAAGMLFVVMGLVRRRGAFDEE